MLKNDIGINAGTIWQLLLEKGSLSMKEIGELTDYQDFLITLSLGWLSRENRIRFIDVDDTLRVELNHSSSDIYY